MRSHAVAALITLTLAACSADGTGNTPAVARPPTAAETGARLYEGNCTPCHQSDGRGVPGVYPSLAGSSVVLGDPGVLARWVIQGVRPASLPAGRYPTAMAKFGWLKPKDAAALFTYLRSSFGNSATPVEAAAVAAAL